MKATLALLVLMAMLLVGCDETGKSLNLFRKDNPELRTVPRDEDGDGLADVFIVVDKNGKAILDDDGIPMEVPGTREWIAKAKADDTLLSNEVTGWATLLGLGPIGAAIGAAIGRWKPNQRAQLWRTRFTETVTDVQAGRDKIGDGQKTLMDSVERKKSADTALAIEEVKLNLLE